MIAGLCGGSVHKVYHDGVFLSEAEKGGAGSNAQRKRRRRRPAGSSLFCQLDVATELFEHVLYSRLVAELGQTGALSRSGRQHGFRKGRSTLASLELVLKVVADENMH